MLGLSRRRTGARAFLALCVGLLLALALVEAIFAWSRARDAPCIWPPHLRRTFAPNPEWIRGVQGLSRFETNSIGLRGEEPGPLDYRIVALGGSTTECLYLDQEEAWPARVQAILRERSDAPVWIGNGGRSGHSSREHRLQMGYVAGSVKGLDAVLLLVGINDLGLRLAEDVRYDPTAMEQPEVLRRVADRAFARSRFASEPFYKRTALYALARTLRRKSSGSRQDEAGAVYARWREHRREGTRREHLPDLTSGLDEYRSNLIECARLARRDGLRLIAMTQPVLWREDLPGELEALLWMGGIGDYQNERGSVYYTSAALAAGMRAYNECLRDLARELDLECFDLAALFESDADAFYDDCHFNEEGAQRVAEAVADYLLKSPPFGGGAAESR